jgi:parallel beta-helix repeat protein
MVAGNTIASNTANKDGGGIVIVGGDDILVNNIVADNQAGAEGGGIRIFEAAPRLLHTTIARNRGSNGDGINVAEHNYIFSSVKLTNTILVSHAVGIYVRDGNTVTLEATLWGSDSWANVTDTIGLVISTTNITGDPAFVAPEAGDYHIGSTSKAIDVGVNTPVTVDIDADSRPAGKGYDIGADEFWRKVYLPLVLRH